mgnify:CR=1 FL=1
MNNNHLVLVSGKSSSGKSASLMSMDKPEGVMYLNCENGKKLPFKSKIIEKMEIFNNSLTAPLPEEQFRKSTIISISKEFQKRGTV